MASQAECESCFQANVLIYLHFQVLWLTPLLESFARKSDSVAAF